MDKAFFGNRYGKGELERGDYINCPLSEAEYLSFIISLREAERIQLKSIEAGIDSLKSISIGYLETNIR